MNLEGIPITVRTLGDDTLEADVGDLEARARVRATVDVDRDRRVEVGQALFEFLTNRLRASLRLDERKLAELDTRASDRAALERGRTNREPKRIKAVGQFLGLLDRNVEHDDALLSGEGDAMAAEPIGQFGHL